MSFTIINLFNVRNTVNFKGKREDKNCILKLTKSNRSITPNEMQKIVTTIDSLSKSKDKSDINFLLDVAEKLEYGVKNGSYLDNFLKNNSSISGKEQIQNTHWENILKTAVGNYLKDNSDGEIGARYNSIFNSEKTDYDHRVWESLKPVNPKHLEIVKLRNELLQKTTNNDDSNLDRIKEITTNLDYFIASSETHTDEKVECLENLNYFMSDEYNITPQLKDKKEQVLSEILNDISLKTPEDKIPNIKKTDQVGHGMCAAISFLRKRLPYEFKAKYVSIVLEEMKDSPKIEVYDVSSPNKERILVSKPELDYDLASKRGYRLVDASVLNWMHIASASSGNGDLIEGMSYVPFDRQNYDLMHDSRLITTGATGKNANLHKILRTTIKMNEVIEELDKHLYLQKHVYNLKQKSEKEYLSNYEALTSDLSKKLSLLIPYASKNEVHNLVKDLLDADKVKKENGIETVRIHAKASNNYKKQEFLNMIIEKFPSAEINEESSILDTITESFNIIKNQESELNSLKNINSPKERAKYYQKLFKLAAFDRVKTEQLAETSSFLTKNLKANNIKPLEYRLHEHLNLLEADIERNNQSKILLKFAENNGINPSDTEQMKKKLTEIKKYFEVDRIEQLNTIMKKLGNPSLNKIVYSTLDRCIEYIKNDPNSEESKEVFEQFAIAEKTPEEAIKYFEELKEKCKNGSPEFPIIAKNLEVQMNSKTVNSFIDSIMNDLSGSEGLDASYYRKLCKNFGANPKVADDLIKKLTDQKLENLQIDDKIKQNISLLGINDDKDELLECFEKSGVILTRETLDKLWDKFESIHAEEEKHDLDKNKSINKFYNFSDKEKQLFNEISAKYRKIKKETKMDYDKLNSEILNDELKELYQKAGQMKGDFWVAEEGSSGLAADEQMNMQGKILGMSLHKADSFDELYEYIKEGNGGGVISNHVSANEISGHAQYVTKVGDIDLINPETGKQEKVRTIFTDNTWGSAEQKDYWQDDKTYRTDYKRGFGEDCETDKNILNPSNDTKLGREYKGFILDKKTMNIGMTEPFLNSRGVHNADSKLPSRLQSKYVDYAYPIYMDSVIDGRSQEVDNKTSELLSKLIFSNKEGISVEVDDFFNALKNPKNSNINIKEIKSVDENVSSIEADLYKFIENDINSYSDYNNLPDSHILKLITRKLVLTQASLDEREGRIRKVMSNKGLDSLQKYLSKQYKDSIASFIEETPTISSIEMLKDCKIGETIIKVIDVLYNPSSDEELVEIYNKKLKNDINTSKFKSLSDSDLGIKYKDAYSIIQGIKGGNQKICSDFEQMVFYHVFYGKFPDYGSSKNDVLNGYRTFACDLSYLVSEKKLNENLAFKTYGVRRAFPILNVYDKNIIEKLFNDIFVFYENASKKERLIADFLHYSPELLQDEIFISQLKDREDKITATFDRDHTSEEMKEEIAEIVKVMETKIDNPFVKKTVANLKQYLNTDLDSISEEQYNDIVSLVIGSVKNFTAKDTYAVAQKRHEEYLTILKQTDKDIKYGLVCNIEPDHRNKLQHDYNEWSQKLKTGNYTEADLMKKKMDKDIQQHIIYDSPKQLLNHIVEQLMEHRSEITPEMEDLWKDQLVGCLSVARKSEIEFTIMDHISNGLWSEIAKNLRDKDYKAITSFKDDKIEEMETVSLNSDLGTSAIILNLEDPINDNHTLKYFLRASKLAPKACERALKFAEVLDTYPQQIEELIAKVMQIDKVTIGRDMNEILKISSDFIESSKEYNKYNYPINDSTLKEYISFMNKNISTSNTNYKKYKENLKNISKEQKADKLSDAIEDAINLSQGDLLTLENEINSMIDSIEYTHKIIEALSEELDDNSKIKQKAIQTLAKIDTEIQPKIDKLFEKELSEDEYYITSYE